MGNNSPRRSKICEFCGEPFWPRNWKDRACQKADCQTALKVAKLQLRQKGHTSKNPDRPTMGVCEWPEGCEETFSIFIRGVIPTLCPFHREEEHKAKRRINRLLTKGCEWPDGCEVVFEISAVGRAAQFCPDHRKEFDKIARLADVIDLECSHPMCHRQQLRVGRGWCSSHNHLFVRFKLTGEKWLAWYEYQNQHCPICEQHLLNGERIHVDHNHNCCSDTSRITCGKCVRGLLHEPCNMSAVGQIETALERGTFYNTLAYLFAVPVARIELALEPLREPELEN